MNHTGSNQEQPLEGGSKNEHQKSADNPYVEMEKPYRRKSKRREEEIQDTWLCVYRFFHPFKIHKEGIGSDMQKLHSDTGNKEAMVEKMVT